MAPLLELTKKSVHLRFEWNPEAENAFKDLKQALVTHAKLVHINDTDPLILYTDASTKAIAGVLVQVTNGVEHPAIYVSHVLSDAATRWGIMELELYAFVYCVLHLQSYLLGRKFIVRTDH
jgi:hypothetical protein